jgi:hypothetical protein
MPKTTPKSAEDYAREAAAGNDATASTPEKPRPVSVTSLDEAQALADLQRFEIERQLPSGRRQVMRVHAASEAAAVATVDGDVLRVQRLP